MDRMIFVKTNYPSPNSEYSSSAIYIIVDTVLQSALDLSRLCQHQGPTILPPSHIQDYHGESR